MDDLTLTLPVMNAHEIVASASKTSENEALLAELDQDYEVGAKTVPSSQGDFDRMEAGRMPLLCEPKNPSFVPGRNNLTALPSILSKAQIDTPGGHLTPVIGRSPKIARYAINPNDPLVYVNFYLPVSQQKLASERGSRSLPNSPKLNYGSINNRPNKKRKEPKLVDESKQVSLMGSVFNLVTNIAGSGLLTLSSGMSHGTGWIPAIIICFIVGWMGKHSFVMIGKSCALTGERDFKGLWAKTIGPNSTFMIDIMIFLQAFALATIRSCVIGDVFPPILRAAGVPAILTGRTTIILFITCFIVFPLSLMKNMKSLASTSTLGFGAIVFSVFFVFYRWIDGSYGLGNEHTLPGEFIDETIAEPSFHRMSLWGLNFSSLVLACQLGMAFEGHYNGPAYYVELKKTNVRKFSNMASMSFIILAILYVTIMCAGYGTFGDVTESDIMLNYNMRDGFSTLARWATGSSCILGYPLVMCGVRKGFISAGATFGHTWLKDEQNHFSITTFLLAVATTLAITVTNLSTIVGITGAILGSSFVYIVPSVIYSSANKLVHGADSDQYKSARWNLLTLPLGLCVGSLGVFMTISSSFAA